MPRKRPSYFDYKIPCNLLIVIILTFSINTAALSAELKKTQQKQPILEPSVQAQYEELSRSLTKAIENEKVLLEETTIKKEEFSQLELTHVKEIGAVKLQLSVFSNLLSLSNAPLEDLEKALSSLKQIIENSALKLKELSEWKENLEQQLKSLDDQKSINETQIENIKDYGSPLPPLLRTTLGQLKEINSLLQQKDRYLRDLQGKAEKLSTEWLQVQEEASIVLQKMEAKIAERKKEELFRRSKNPLTALGIKEIQEELENLLSITKRSLTTDFWMNHLRFVWDTGGVLLITSFLVLVIVEWILIWIRKLFRSYITESMKLRKEWLWIFFQLITGSLPLAGVTVFVYVYSLARNLYEASTPLRLIIFILLLWLFSSWVIHFLKLISERITGDGGKLILSRIRRFISVVRWLILGHLCLQELLGRNGYLLLIYRFLLEILFLIWTIELSRFVKNHIISDQASQPIRIRRAAKFLVGWLYVIATGGILLELAGYSFLAVLWFLNWGRTLVLCLWLFIFFMVLREWEEVADRAFELGEDSESVTRSSFEWLTVRLLWVVWAFAVIVGILIAWGAEQTVIVTLFRILNTPIPIGSFTFRLSGLFYAALILALTHVGVRLVKHLLRHRILRNSGLELGLQESITTISGYVLWFFGTLAALNALGFSGTSLTVVFGALGVGLGFGLQNIFNNFISGLILLFERPIQVGDAIEVDGVWGEVKKINFRSTVIQTWDNASLIIPNSEFISGRVTNWSFKDLRVRSNIDIGVSYGSDVELVRKTLLEIANNHPNVLKTPEPSVLFLNFGDSALIFRLRVWTTVNIRLQVETEIRFEIYRLFNERKIEIPFPQRDIHIKSIVSSNS